MVDGTTRNEIIRLRALAQSYRDQGYKSGYVYARDRNADLNEARRLDKLADELELAG